MEKTGIMQEFSKKKQNVFDDFISAAEYLIAENITSPEFLAVRGGSNGGLLVGAVMTQRPELMKVALPAVGVLDMLRYINLLQELDGHMTMELQKNRKKCLII